MQWLLRAIKLAAEARETGNPPFGSLLISAGSVLAEERNTVLTDQDITAHPELKLARWAARELSPEQARNTTMFTSCQPCSMCVGAIARSGVGRVVFALSTSQLEDLKPRDAMSPDSAPVTYEGPLMFDDARRPVDGYYGG